MSQGAMDLWQIKTIMKSCLKLLFAFVIAHLELYNNSKIHNKMYLV